MSLLHEDRAYSCKDACMAWDGSQWQIFFSAFDEERSVITRTSSQNLIRTEASDMLFSGADQERISMCSLEIIQIDNGWLLIFNSWDSKNGAHNSLYYSN